MNVAQFLDLIPLFSFLSTPFLLKILLFLSMSLFKSEVIMFVTYCSY